MRLDVWLSKHFIICMSVYEKNMSDGILNLLQALIQALCISSMDQILSFFCWFAKVVRGCFEMQ